MPAPGSTESPFGETNRIRAVYLERDRGRARGRWISEAYRRLNRERLDEMDKLIRLIAPPPDGRILDVGCGSGYDLSHWIEAGWRPSALAGVDLMRDRIAGATAACRGVDLRVTEGTQLPFADGAFAVGTATTVFSSILDAAVRRELFTEMERVVRTDGLVIVYDFVVRKPTNPNVTGLSLAALTAMAGRAPNGSIRVSPILQVVAAGAAVHPRLADVAMRLAPRTHRLSYWQARH